jgi:hypothetical protein
MWVSRQTTGKRDLSHLYRRGRSITEAFRWRVRPARASSVLGVPPEGEGSVLGDTDSVEHQWNTHTPDLGGRADRVHFASLPDEQLAIVRRDLGDFRPPLAEALRRGRAPMAWSACRRASLATAMGSVASSRRSTRSWRPTPRSTPRSPSAVRSGCQTRLGAERASRAAAPSRERRRVGDPRLPGFVPGSPPTGSARNVPASGDRDPASGHVPAAGSTGRDGAVRYRGSVWYAIARWRIAAMRTVWWSSASW